MNNLFKTKNKGYAILFTMVIVGIISAIALGLASVSYKQLILSSVAKDSQVSFYQADMASECGLYIENKIGVETLSNSWSCGINSIDEKNNFTLNNSSNSYNLNPTDPLSLNPCLNIMIDKSKSDTVITAKGYNICNPDNLRTVEREIVVSSY